MSREKEFFDAIEVIKKAIADRVVTSNDYGNLKEITMIAITQFSAKPAAWYNYNSFTDRESGFYLDDFAKIQITDPLEVIKKDRLKAQEEYDQAVRAATSVNASVEAARKKLADLDNQIMGSKTNG